VSPSIQEQWVPPELEDVGTADLTATPQAGRERALLLADIISDTPARDTVVLDIHDLSPFADYFVITAGANERQLRRADGRGRLSTPACRGRADEWLDRA
jgi:hypothetical protein